MIDAVVLIIVVFIISLLIYAMFVSLSSLITQLKLDIQSIIYGVEERLMVEISWDRGTLRNIEEKIDKLNAKAIEEKKVDIKTGDEIKIGDEVESLYDHRTVIENTIPWIVTGIREGYNGKKSYYGIDAEGALRNNDFIRKTGRHFDISKILEEMKA